MKIFFSIFLIIGLISSSEINQKKKNEIHLSFNILPDKFSNHKYLDNNGFVNFYINNEHFLSRKEPEILVDEELNNINIIDIQYLNKIYLRRKKISIKREEKNGVIKISTNSEFFKIIYLYEKRDDRIYRYEVDWIDEISD